jgi:hypothetical protein
MLRARRGVMHATGNATRSAERGLAYKRTRKAKPAHGGLRPRMGASDLFDVGCWCGWSSTNHETRELAVSAAEEHRARVRAVGSGRGAQSSNRKVVRSTAKSSGRKVVRSSAKTTVRTEDTKQRQAQAKRPTRKTAAADRSKPSKKTRSAASNALKRPKRVSKSPDTATASTKSEHRTTVVFRRTRVMVDRLSTRKWRVTCKRCGVSTNCENRDAAITTAQRHATACGRSKRKHPAPKKSSRR